MYDFIKKYYFLVAASTTGICIFIFLGTVLYDRETSNINRDFNNDVDNKASAFEREILLNTEVLYSIQGLFNTPREVEAHEFQSLTESIFTRHPNIQSLQWVPKVVESSAYAKLVKKRSVYLESLQQNISVQPDVYLSNGIHFPIQFIEPIAENHAFLDYDISSNDEIFTVLMKTIENGGISFSGKIELFQTIDKGFLVVLPVYNDTKNKFKKSSSQLKGFVIGGYDIGDLFISSTERFTAEGLHLVLTDEGDVGKEILYEFKSENATEQPISSYTYKKKLGAFGDKQWSIIAKPSENYISERRTIFPILITTLGSLLVALMTLHNYKVTRQAEIVEATVRIRTKELYEAKKVLEELSQTDGLTRVGNRRYFDSYLEQEWGRALREKTPLSIIMLDVDNFKLFNDLYGHIAGDECLIAVAQSLKHSSKRTSDVVTRYGGEEFTIVLPNTIYPFAVAEACRLEIEQLKIPHADSTCSEYVTASFGASTVVPDSNSTVSDLIAAADSALYEAKEGGRNRIEVYNKIVTSEEKPSTP